MTARLRAKYRKVKDRILNYFYMLDDYEGVPAERPKPPKTAKVKFFIIEKQEDADRALEELKQGGLIAVLDLRPLHAKSFAHLKFLTGKMERACSSGKLQMRFYRKEWLLVAPGNVKFYKAKR
jgi:SepF-like predicted cell division protein (DUF552 family)